jgi:hypothetical protein
MSSDLREATKGLPELNQAIDLAALFLGGGTLMFLTGQLYREVQVKNPQSARFSLKNGQGLFFVKLYRPALVELAQTLEAGTRLGVVGEVQSFVNRRCKNHHVFVEAVALVPLSGSIEGWPKKN